MEVNRCEWCLSSDIYIAYHDQEWGVPITDDDELFEMLNLECAQAGLSWITVLKKRAHYRKVFDNFDAKKMSKYKQPKIDKLLQDPGIIRNKLKVNAFVTNAQAYLKIKETQSFADYIWSFVDGKPIQNKCRSMSDVPVSTDISKAMSKQLKKDGFKFVGETIVYAFMQAAGLVNDHVTSCHRYKEVAKLKLK